MTLSGEQAELTNWSKSTRSTCTVYLAGDSAGIRGAMDAARARHLSVIPHGAGHSYTDAALNTGAAVINMTPMHRILAWDAERGVMRVEPGVTLREMVAAAWQDGWWPVVSPSTPEVTLAGCAAMNVNGRNAWKCGPFGASILSMDVLLATGEARTLTPDSDRQLFQAFVGSMGLLGFITALTVQMQRIHSGYVTLRRRSAARLDELFDLFAEEEPRSDFMEAWLDGFASGVQLGRGHLTSAVLSDAGGLPTTPFHRTGRVDRLEGSFIDLAAGLGRPWLEPGVHMANRVHYGLNQGNRKGSGQQSSLASYTYWPAAAFAAYHAFFPQGVETFQAFIPARDALEIFRQLLCYSQQQGCLPLWCVLKQHRRDPFLLSYQVDGFSLELNYQRNRQSAQRLKQVLQYMIALVVEAGGRFYLAKDHYLTAAQYRQSMGDEAVDTFLRFKQACDPEMLLQSDLYRRVFLEEKS